MPANVNARSYLVSYRLMVRGAVFGSGTGVPRRFQTGPGNLGRSVDPCNIDPAKLGGSLKERRLHVPHTGRENKNRGPPSATSVDSPQPLPLTTV